MTIESFFVVDATILRAGTRTSRTDEELADWSDTTSTNVKGWRSQEATSEPTGPGRLLVSVTREVFYVPADTDVTEHDRIAIDGVTFDIAGKPRTARTPRGEHHLELTLVAVEG